MGLNPLSGVIFLALGGLAAATNFIPFRQIKRWSWEIYWPVQAFAAWLVAPVLFACLLVPNCCALLSQADSHTLWLTLLFGMAWGVSAMSFGLAVRYLGIALGYAITLGFYVVFGAVAASMYTSAFGRDPSAASMLPGAALCLLGVALTAFAGHRKELEMTLEVKLEAGEQDYHFPKGLAMAAVAGLAALFLGIGLSTASPITALAQSDLAAHGLSATWASLPALVILLAGGFLTNLVWSTILIARKGFPKQFLGEPGTNPMRAVATSGDTLVDFDPLDPSTYDRLAPSTLIANYAFAAIAGLLWYLQLVFYFRGTATAALPSTSPKLLQLAFALIFAALWGLAVKEWRGTTAQTRILAGLGTVLVIGGVVLVGR